MQFNDVQLQYESLRDEIDGAVRDVLAGGRYIFGPSMVAFEEEFARYTRSADAIAVGSGTAALTLAFKRFAGGDARLRENCAQLIRFIL